MNDTAQAAVSIQQSAVNSDNALIRQGVDLINNLTEGIEMKKPPVIYDADARNRFEFEVREGVKLYETAHIFEPLSDERYLQWIREFRIRGTEDDISEEAREASVRLWDDIIFDVAKIKYPEGTDFRQWIPPMEKVEAINALLAVAIAEDIERISGDRTFGDEAKTISVSTEAFFNGERVEQVHELRPVTLELEKKYSRIQAKRFKQEQIGGLRNRKAKIEYIPQDHRLGELYDEMAVSASGFAGGKVPLRFKTTVIHHLFQEKLDQKKSQA